MTKYVSIFIFLILLSLLNLARAEDKIKNYYFLISSSSDTILDAMVSVNDNKCVKSIVTPGNPLKIQLTQVDCENESDFRFFTALYINQKGLTQKHCIIIGVWPRGGYFPPKEYAIMPPTTPCKSSSTGIKPLEETNTIEVNVPASNDL